MLKNNKLPLFAVLALSFLLGAGRPAQAPSGRVSPDDPRGFVMVADVVPDAIIEMRYYGTYNFVGTRIDGYLSPVALLARRAADSLRAVSDELAAHGYRIKIFDAYRPQMAVDHFSRWGTNPADTAMKRYFYPHTDKHNLFNYGYIAHRSGHSRGSTVDLTIVDMSTGQELDMGTPFDYLGPESRPGFGGDIAKLKYHRNNKLRPRQFYCRMFLRRVMMRHGFRPYDREWWHFTLRDEPYPDTYFTFPVRPLRRPR